MILNFTNYWQGQLDHLILFQLAIKDFILMKYLRVVRNPLCTFGFLDLASYNFLMASCIFVLCVCACVCVVCYLAILLNKVLGINILKIHFCKIFFGSLIFD